MEPSTPRDAKPTPDVRHEADAQHPDWTRAAWLVGVGLFAVGVALGILYYDHRVYLHTVLDLKAAGELDPHDDLPDVLSLSRVLAAGVFGCVGVMLCGVGGVLVLSRCRWFAR